MTTLARARRINSKRPTVRHLAHAKTIDDLQAIARRNVPNFVYEYLVGGADGEVTLRRNRAVLDAMRFSPRVLTDISARDLSVELFGRCVKLPFMIGPTGGNGLLWPKGDRLLGEVAAEAGIPMAQSIFSMLPISDVASIPGLRHWFQLYTVGPDSVYETLLERAEAAGSEALVVTVDGAVSGNRQWDRKNYAAPQKLSLRSKMEVAMHPRWTWRTLIREGAPNFDNLKEFIDLPDPDMFDVTRWTTGKDPRTTWKTIARIRTLWPGKLLLKGILRVDDVLSAAASGVDGVILSNHGGRQIEPTISPLEVLPAARSKVGPDYPLLIDSGFKRGHDIVAAHALGATCVLLGRSMLFGLAAGGKPGAARVIEILREEVDRVLTLIGVSSLDALTPDALTGNALAALETGVLSAAEHGGE